jgi:hypothetical protein
METEDGSRFGRFAGLMGYPVPEKYRLQSQEDAQEDIIHCPYCGLPMGVGFGGFGFYCEPCNYVQED